MAVIGKEVLSSASGGHKDWLAVAGFLSASDSGLDWKVLFRRVDIGLRFSGF